MDDKSKQQFVQNLLGFVEEAANSIFQIEMMAEQEDEDEMSAIAESIGKNLILFIEGTKEVYGIKANYPCVI